MLEINDDMISPEQAVTNGPELYRRKVQWFRITLLSIGLLLIFGGMGMSLGFHFSGDNEFVKMASLGAIPFMTGLGLLLFHYLTSKEAI